MRLTEVNQEGKFAMIELPYAPNALEPAISAETIGFHYGKHLQTYVNNLNALLPGSWAEGKPLEQIVKESVERNDVPMGNNAGQTLNHNLYFTQFMPAKEDNKPVGNLAKAIDEKFGSFDQFKAEFEKKAAGLFGSGWAWLASKDREIDIYQYPNAQNPLIDGLKPLLTADVWEHAYYLDYQNRRPAHIASLWQIINWQEVEERYNNGIEI